MRDLTMDNNVLMEEDLVFIEEFRNRIAQEPEYTAAERETQPLIFFKGAASLEGEFIISN